MKEYIVICLIAAAGLNSYAGPAQRAHLPAQPAWVLHLDVDAIRPATVGKFLMEQLERPAAENKMGALTALLNFDPRTALSGVSLFSSTQNPEDAVMVVYGDFDSERLVTLAKAAKGHQTFQHRSHTIHNWVDAKRTKKAGEERRTYAAVAGNKAVLGQKQETVAAALEVMDGFTASLASTKEFQQIGAASGGKFLQGAGRKLQTSSKNPNAALLKLSDEVRFELGEAKGVVNGNFSLKTRDEEVAGHLNSVAQGLLALMKLNTEKPGQAALAEAIELHQQGDEVSGTLSLSSHEVVQGLKALAGKKAAGL